MKRIIEAVPNFSEGRNKDHINKIKEGLNSRPKAKVLHVDAGYAANRTVYTLAGEPDDVIEALFQGAAVAIKLIDMRQHEGEHPAIGSLDVCPLIAVSGVSEVELVDLSKKLARRLGEELNIPCYLYEKSADLPYRKRLEQIRKGGYWGVKNKMAHEEWKPDFGPSYFNAITGATVIGVRNFLIAYNVNIETSSVDVANEIAYCIRTSGYKGVPGKFENLKAIGWYIEEYGICQVSTNITDISTTRLIDVYNEVKSLARNRNIEVNSSEVIGLIPRQPLLEAGKYFLPSINNKQELVECAVNRLGLSRFGGFCADKRVLENMLL